MSVLLGADWFVIPAFGICIFTISYLWSDKIINFFYNRTMGSREEVFKLMDKMMIDIDQKKVNILLMLLSFGLGAVFFALFWPNIIPGAIFGIAITLGGFTAPKFFMQSLWEKRCNRVTDQMIDGMTILANGVGAGLSVPQSMERVVTNMTGPLPQEFNLVLNKVRLGMTVEDALNEFGDRIPRQDVQMFVTSVNILKETGGNLAETFSTIVTVVRERQKVEKKIQAMTAQGLMQGIIISCIPVIILVIFLVIDPGFVMPLFTKPLGWFFLTIMLGLQVIGGVAMKKMVTIKV